MGEGEGEAAGEGERARRSGGGGGMERGRVLVSHTVEDSENEVNHGAWQEERRELQDETPVSWIDRYAIVMKSRMQCPVGFYILVVCTTVAEASDVVYTARLEGSTIQGEKIREGR